MLNSKITASVQIKYSHLLYHKHWRNPTVFMEFLNNNVNLVILSSLEKIYRNDKIPNKSISSFSMLRNEKKSFQVIVETKESFKGNLIINTSFPFSLYSVEHIKSDFPMAKGSDDYYRFSDDGYYPDLLLPITNEITFNKGINVFWVEISASNELVGNQNIEIIGNKIAIVEKKC